MHPFGGIPVCPRCSKQVYAAEQVMGPGRKLYHKPCLACTLCNKRLDSLTLLEHDQLPYCRSCHIKNFGTRDLRHANLPHREELPSSLAKGSQPPLPFPPRVTSPSRATSPTRASPPTPLLKPTRSLASPTGVRSPTFPRNGTDFEGTGNRDNEGKLDMSTNSGPYSSPTASAPASRPAHHFSRSVESVVPVAGPAPTATGMRYGAILNRPAANTFAALNLTGNSTGSPRQWGGDTPVCPRCGKNVYFAEQVKAVGKTYHKGCLRCLECKTLLDSSRLRDHNGVPYCMRCYGKLHGPQGSGYALLGKAGG